MSVPSPLPTLSRADLHQHLSDGAWLVTVNNRLAHHLRRDFERVRQASGQQVWQNPRILPWNAFLSTLHTSLLDTVPGVRPALTTFQEISLWQRVIRDSAQGQNLLRPEAAADQAMMATRLLYDWRLPREALSGSKLHEADCFSDWLTEFEQQLEDLDRTSAARLADDLLHHGVTALQLPAEIVLAGFGQQSPLQSGFLAALAAKGVRLFELTPPTLNGVSRCVQAENLAHEIELIGDWANSQLQQTPDAHLGIVVPELGAMRQQIDDGLAAHLHVETSMSPTPADPPCYEFSLGLPLDQYPVIADALTWLELLTGRLALSQLAGLLTSPFLGTADTEFNARGTLTYRLRNLGRPMIDRRLLLQEASGTMADASFACHDLHARLTRIDQFIQQLPRVQPPSGWARSFTRILELLGWPGPRALDSSEYQLQQRFLRLLAEYASIDAIEPETALRASLRLLRQLAARTSFQIANRDAPVQILGAREAQGLRFDRLWVMGLDDTAWPPAPSPNPLLPIEMQREAGIPQATGQGQLENARAQLDGLRRAAAEVNLSWSAREGDRDLGASPLLADIPMVAAKASSKRPPELPPCESIDDNRARPPAGVGGGTALLADQSICPFRAFARHRLHARQPPEPGKGIEPWRIGNLLHRALESIWEQLGNQASLRQLSANDRSTLLSATVAKGLQQLRRERPDVMEATFCAVEQERLVRLLQDWLELETQRPMPFDVIAVEAEIHVELGGLPLSLRLDRLDRLTDGTELVIDYKYSRDQNLRGWSEDRIRDPQLPLYATVHEDRVSGAAFACLRGNRRGFHGYSAQQDMLPGVSPPKPGWEEMRSHWRQGLHALAEEIRQGIADVDPTDPTQSCRYCDLHSVCRIRDAMEPAPESGDD